MIMIHSYTSNLVLLDSLAGPSMRPKNVVAPLDPRIAKDGPKLKVQVCIFDLLCLTVLMCIQIFLEGCI